VALEILKNSVSTVSRLHDSYQQLFVGASSAESTSMADLIASTSTKTSAAIALTQQAVDAVLADLFVLEQFLRLSIPQMEDGNNFGVDVQMQALQQIQEIQDMLSFTLNDDILLKYEPARAEAMEKAKVFPVRTRTESSTATSTSKTSDKVDENKKESTKETKQATQAVTTEASPEWVYRQQAVLTVDTVYARKAQTLYRYTISNYAALLDFIIKNQTKITAPKGTHGPGQSAYSSMY
jgi:Proteasome activator pa28 beta subunit